MSERPPLGLSVVVRDSSGAETIWWSGDRFPYNRPQAVSFQTRRGEGFSSFTCTLARDGRLSWVDLAVLNDVVVVGDDGTVLYEGQITGTPRTFDSSTGATISVTAVGHMVLAQDEPFREIVVDRDLAKWQAASVQRKLTDAAVSFRAIDPTVLNDTTTGQPSLSTAVSDTWVAGAKPDALAMYDAQGVELGALYYAWKRNSNVNNADTNWQWVALLSSDDILTSTDTTGTLRAAGPGTGSLTVSTTGRKYAFAQLLYNAAGGTAGTEYAIYWTLLAAVGNHGLTNQATISATQGPAFWLSDILVNLFQRFAPQLSTAGILRNTTLIEQAVYEDQTVFDAAQDLNKYSLWELAVWENKTVHYHPADLTDYDWEARIGEHGVSTTLQGDDATELRNGIVVVYDDIQTGRRERLSPDDWAELRDDSPTNPANKQGRRKWGEPYALSVACTQTMALQAGRMQLAQVNQPKEAGTVTLQGHVRDRAGHWQPVSHVRAGQTIALTNFANSRPRLIVETDYDADNSSLSLSTDNTFALVDAFLDRITAARGARGLS